MTRVTTDVQRFSPAHPHWGALLDHLTRCGMRRWIAGDDDAPFPGLIILGAIVGDAVAGHIALKVQPITIPASALSEGKTVPVTDHTGRPLAETFVMTFAVDEIYRRQGYGRALQQAALDLTRTLGCYQMRSWSSVDKIANYALKLALGFAAHPAIQTAPGGQVVSGVYFVKTV